MKRLGLTTAVILAAAAAQADTTNVTVNVASLVPDNNASGLTSQFSLSGMNGPVTSVTVGLNISGGYNGDLYGYLADPNGGFFVLLNRVGVGGGNTNGYGDSGFNITLDDSGAYSNVHYYQNHNPTITGGVLGGTWGTDGENVDPQGSSVGSAPATTSLTSLNGSDPNGTWVLFLSDLSPGGVSTWNDWTLNITTAAVPEPEPWALIAMGVLAWPARRFFGRR